MSCGQHKAQHPLTARGNIDQPFNHDISYISTEFTCNSTQMRAISSMLSPSRRVLWERGLNPKWRRSLTKNSSRSSINISKYISHPTLFHHFSGVLEVACHDDGVILEKYSTLRKSFNPTILSVLLSIA